LEAGFAAPERTSVVPNGVDSVFTTEPDARVDAEADRLVGGARIGADVLHVGSTIPRKRLDVLLRAFARVAADRPDARLVRVGGLSEEQRQLARALSITDRVLELPFLDRPVLAAVYRRAAVTVVCSDREGFGLPVLESLACGAPVVASDIPALRETGGRVAWYCAPGDVEAFAVAIGACVSGARPASRTACRQQASRFSWASCAERVEGVYRDVAGATARSYAVSRL
jgi:glycosyltransferase involved in cell wall biosynthesis